jgi:hypothetical protein
MHRAETGRHALAPALADSQRCPPVLAGVVNNTCRPGIAGLVLADFGMSG